MLQPRVLMAGVLVSAAAPAAPAVAATATAPWGAAIVDARAEERVRSFLDTLAAGRGHEVAGRALAIGPELWRALGRAASMVGGIAVNHAGGEARAYRGAEIARILDGEAMRLVGQHF